MPKLTVGYSVLADRAGNLKQEFPSSFETLVVVQGGETEKRLRNANYFFLQSLGVAKSRNKAIEEAKGEYLVFADDDIIFETSGLQEAIQYLDEHPEIALLLVRATDPSGVLRKRYPTSRQRLSLYNSARAATYEMIIRVSEIKRRGIRFDENFGAGVENYLGDEYIFIADLLRSGGKAEFVPITIASHPVDSSGAGWGTKRDRIARARIFDRVFGVFAPFVRVAFGARRLNDLGLRNYLLFILGK